MKKTDCISIGNCGEYFVAAELERNGFTAAVPMSNTASFDVLAINRSNNRQIALQVKTNHTKQKRGLCHKRMKPFLVKIFTMFLFL